MGDSAAPPAGTAILAKLAAMCCPITRHQHPIELAWSENPSRENWHHPGRSSSSSSASHSLPRHIGLHHPVTAKQALSTFLKRHAVAEQLRNLSIPPEPPVHDAIPPLRPRQRDRQATRAQSQQQNSSRRRSSPLHRKTWPVEMDIHRPPRRSRALQ